MSASKKEVGFLIRLTREEHARLKLLAKQSNLSASELVRRVVMGYAIADPRDDSLIRGLLKVNADMARLGNLLKRAASKRRVPFDRAQTLLEGLESTRAAIKAKVMEIDAR